MLLRVFCLMILILSVVLGICHASGIELPKIITNPMDTLIDSQGLGLDLFNLSKYEQDVLSNTVKPKDILETFDSIGGNEETIKLLRQLLIEPLKNKELYSGKKLLRPPNGIILYGPPGTGKTMLARAIASEMGGSFISVSPDFVENKFFGESEKNIRAIFSLADKMKPSIIFMDEIDGMLSRRTCFDQQHVNSCKTQFLSMMDGVTKRDDSVIVIGATNSIDQVDPAVLRRMRLHLKVDLPDTQGRKDIMNKIIPLDEVSSELDLDALAEAAEGFSGSDLHEMCKLAAQFALKNGNDIISQDDFIEAQEKLTS